MRKKKLAIGFFLLIGLLATVIAGCGEAGKEGKTEGEEKPTLRIGYLPITHSLPLVVTDKLDGGKYKNFKLELVKFSSWPELTEALNSGQIQGAVHMLELAMVSRERGIAEQVLALSHRNGDVMVVAKDINSVKDLKGKKVAIPHRMSGHNILLYRALKNNGLTLDDVQWIEMAPPDMPAALARGDVKGYIVAEPFGAKAVLGGYGKVLLRAQDIWPNWICCGLVLRSEFIKKYPEATQEFVDSFVSAGQFIMNNQEEAIKIAQAYMNIEAKIWKKSFEWGISYSDLRPQRQELKRLQDYLVQLKLLKGPINVDTLLNDSFVKKAYEKVK